MGKLKFKIVFYSQGVLFVHCVHLPLQGFLFSTDCLPNEIHTKASSLQILYETFRTRGAAGRHFSIHSMLSKQNRAIATLHNSWPFSQRSFSALQ